MEKQRLTFQEIIVKGLTSGTLEDTINEHYQDTVTQLLAEMGIEPEGNFGLCQYTYSDPYIYIVVDYTNERNKKTDYIFLPMEERIIYEWEVD